MGYARRATGWNHVVLCVALSVLLSVICSVLLQDQPRVAPDTTVYVPALPPPPVMTAIPPDPDAFVRRFGRPDRETMSADSVRRLATRTLIYQTRGVRVSYETSDRPSSTAGWTFLRFEDAHTGAVLPVAEGLARARPPVKSQ